METLDGATTERKIAVVEFSEEGGVKKETKTDVSQLAFFKRFLSSLPPFISFGESFGSLKATGTDGVLDFDEGRFKAMRKEVGIKEKK